MRGDKDIVDSKKCNSCKEVKSIKEFYFQKKKSKRKGEYIYYYPECKECTSRRSVKWQTNNKDKRKVHYTRRNQKPEMVEGFRERSKQARENGNYKKWTEKNKDKISSYHNKKQKNKKHLISDIEWENCKNYFNNRCAYCGLHKDDHFRVIRGQPRKEDLHKDHVDDQGVNDLSNCVPSCHNCNSQKWTFKFDDWYIAQEFYCDERFAHINNWLRSDYRKYINA